MTSLLHSPTASLRLVLLGVLLPNAVVAYAAEESTSTRPLVESLRAAELAFAASVADKNRERFAELISEEAIFVGQRVLRGKQEILDAWNGFFAPDGPSLEWHPEVVVVQASGDLGLTRGPYTLSGMRPDGGKFSESGQFMSIWQRQADGSWKIVFDSGCPPCDPGE